MIKRAFFPVVIILSSLSLTFSSCDVIEDFLTQDDVAAGLKEALRVGTDTSISKGSAVDGYFANALIKILLPPEANAIVNVINSVPGIGPELVSEVVLRLNRAAEDAAPQATDILFGAITNITITDALSILNGPDDAATTYLKSETQGGIVSAFKPHIQTSLENVGAQSSWETLTSNYNSVAPFLGESQVNTDLAQYTTDKATDGLFILIGEEEKKIREDPLHRVSEILQNVFGEQ